MYPRLVDTSRRWAAAARPLVHGAINKRVVSGRATFLEPLFVLRVEIVPGRCTGRWEGRCVEARRIVSRWEESSLALVLLGGHFFSTPSVERVLLASFEIAR